MFKMLPAPPVIPGPIRIVDCEPRDKDLASSTYRMRLAGYPAADGTPRRPRMRMCVEVLCRWNGKMRYHRLPGTAAIMDAQDTEQLEWLLASVMEFIQQFDGKHISGPPATREHDR